MKWGAMDPCTNPNPAEAPGRRNLPDRRARPTIAISRYTFVGGRRANRRESDPRERYYVDWIDGPLAWALLATVILITFDTFSTLFILANGGVELNPLMAWILTQGHGWFLVTKLVPPLFVFPLLAVHRHFFIGRFGTLILLGMYLWVFTVHLVVLFKMLR